MIFSLHMNIKRSSRKRYRSRQEVDALTRCPRGWRQWPISTTEILGRAACVEDLLALSHKLRIFNNVQ